MFKDSNDMFEPADGQEHKSLSEMTLPANKMLIFKIILLDPSKEQTLCRRTYGK